MTQDRAQLIHHALSAAPQIVGLWGLAVAQPVYDLLVRNTEFLAERGTSLGEAVVFAVGLSLLVPLLVVGIALLVGLLSTAAQLAVHFWSVALMAAAVVLNAAQALRLPAPALIGATLLAGFILAWSIERWGVLRSWSRLLAIAAIVFPVVFFWRTPASTWLGSSAHEIRDQPRAANRVPIVFVVFDELSLVSLLGSDGEIDARSFPNFAALSRQATWYPLATTVARNTSLAIPALLTGRYPMKDRQPTVADYPDNLFTLLSAQYQITAKETVTRLCPPEICRQEEEPLPRRLGDLSLHFGLAYLHVVLPPTLAANVPDADQKWVNLGAAERAPSIALAPVRRWLRRLRVALTDDRAKDFRAFVDRLDHASSPTLHFYTTLLPHLGFAYLPSGRLYTSDGNPAGQMHPHDRWGDDEWAAIQDYQRYQLQVGFVDRLLGCLVRRLEEIELYDSALLVVTADHGASFQANGSRRGLAARQFAEVMAVPLFVKLPGQRQGQRDERSVELVDVLPTILDVIGLDPRVLEPLSGRSLLAAPAVRSQHRVLDKEHGSGAKKLRSFSRHRVRRAIKDAVRRKVDLFGAEGFSTRFYQLGEYGYLVGREVSEFEVQPASRVKTEIRFPFPHLEFDPPQGFVPAHILGRSWPVPPGAPQHFAIAVNGTIQAVTRTWDESPRHRAGEWAAIVDEAAFVDGANRIDVLHVDKTPPGVRLARTANLTSYAVAPTAHGAAAVAARQRSTGAGNG